MADETGWMIERKSPRVEWWTGTHLDLTDDRSWTSNPNNGIRFATWAGGCVVSHALFRHTWPRKAHESAEYRAMQIDVTEHIWHDPTQLNERVGDRGQRYEVRCMDGDGKERVIGWTDDPTGGGFVRGVSVHPSWHSPRVIDRRAQPQSENLSEKTHES